jgi:hypothetical protein
VSTARHQIVRLGAFVMTLSMLLGIIMIHHGEAAKPYDGTTVKVIVNAEYVKYAMTLIEKELFDKHGIKLEVGSSRVKRL